MTREEHSYIIREVTDILNRLMEKAALDGFNVSIDMQKKSFLHCGSYNAIVASVGYENE